MNDLVIKLTGEIQDSNFEEWKSGLIAQIKSANKELITDDDFVDAESTVKKFKAAEKSLVEAKQSALEQAADIQKLFGAIDEISGEARQARLSLERQIKQRKEEIKESLVGEYYAKAEQAYDFECDDNDDFRLVAPRLIDESAFRNALSRRKTIESMRQALSGVVEDIQLLINDKVDAINNARWLLDNIAEDQKALFQDERALLAMEPELLQATIDKRIATHEAQEAKRKADEAEAKRKAEEAQRLAEEEQLAQTAEQKAEPQSTPQELKPEQGPQPGPASVSTAPVRTESKPDQESGFFQVTVLISADVESAKSLANEINDQYGSRDEVVQIKLARSQEAA